ncbi:LOW QUALITY PROTEIN: hypothetical protein MAR_018354 [Mya arenaria]|uniref:Uncharacterized protein n=1 Tax=Mya arenaria TaxID=6604 RepID=A0ABY7EMI4_MYAAR|nr:LOW QUALITY PROTEIN: hypothetical protein MAR_018354 [Mya arenaria]
MTFVGIELDSIAMVKRLPFEKVEKICDCLSRMKRKKKDTLQELQSLTGLLNFACAVVVPGRAFLRRMIDLTLAAPSQETPHVGCSRRFGSLVRVHKHFQWHFYDAPRPFDRDSLTALDLYTDASYIGFGDYFNDRYFAGVWPVDSVWHTLHITVKELFPLVLALELWGSLLQNKCIVFHSDNEDVVHIINKQSSKDKHLMKLVRRFVVKTLQHNVLCRAEHIPGSHNILVDFLSRDQVHKFLPSCPATTLCWN